MLLISAQAALKTVFIVIQAESANVRLQKIEEASRATKKQELSPAETEKEAGNAAFKQKQYQKVGHQHDPTKPSSGMKMFDYKSLYAHASQKTLQALHH